MVIPNKREIRGKRYRFVRFYNVENARSLAMKLDNLFMGKQKLFVNIPRFQRKQEGRDPERKQSAEKMFKTSVQFRPKPDSIVQIMREGHRTRDLDLETTDHTQMKRCFRSKLWKILKGH